MNIPQLTSFDLKVLDTAIDSHAAADMAAAWLWLSTSGAEALKIARRPEPKSREAQKHWQDAHTNLAFNLARIRNVTFHTVCRNWGSPCIWLETKKQPQNCENAQNAPGDTISPPVDPDTLPSD